MLAENGIVLEYTDEAVQSIAEAGYDPEVGARPVKRVIQRKVLNQLSKDILSARVDKSKPIVIDSIDDHVYFRNWTINKRLLAACLLILLYHFFDIFKSNFIFLTIFIIIFF